MRGWGSKVSSRFAEELLVTSCLPLYSAEIYTAPEPFFSSLSHLVLRIAKSRLCYLKSVSLHLLTSRGNPVPSCTTNFLHMDEHLMPPTFLHSSSLLGKHWILNKVYTTQGLTLPPLKASSVTPLLPAPVHLEWPFGISSVPSFSSPHLKALSFATAQGCSPAPLPG